jgi:hypothetical protein
MAHSLEKVWLQDLAAFSGLEEISHTFKVNFSLFGGAATRAWLYTYFSPGIEFDLFDLTPFASDVDISHSGPKEKTADISQAIRETVPFAQWCRWAILDSKSGESAAQNRAMSTWVPMRSLALSTKSATRLPEDLQMDFERCVVNFYRSPVYSASQFAKEGRDVEIFGLLLALNTLADVREIAGEGRLAQDGKLASEWLDTMSAERDLKQISQNANLQHRLWTKMANNYVRAGNDAQIFNKFLKVALRSSAFAKIEPEAKAVFIENAPVSISHPTSAGDFRVPELSPTVITGPEAHESLIQVYGDNHLADVYETKTPIIDPIYDLVAFIPELTVIRGSVGGNEPDASVDMVFESWASDEFLHVAWPHDKRLAHMLNPKGLTACMMPWAPTPSIGLSGGAAVGGVQPDGMDWIRVDIRDMMPLGQDAKDAKASVLILQSRLME